jgi:hypothetical protein
VHRLDDDPHPANLRVEPEAARRVASAFLTAPSAAPPTLVEAAYRALAAQSWRYFEWITQHWARPVRVVFGRCGVPYATAAELSESVRRHRFLEITTSACERDRRHPALDDSPGSVYDRFRAVHDVVSHGLLQLGFDRDGEYAAWHTEHRMYHGLARWALATELHAEHSVRWTTGEVADHRAVLVDRRLLATSLRAACHRWPQDGEHPRQDSNLRPCH